MKSPLYGIPKELYIRHRCFKNAIEYYGSACMLSPFSPSSKYDQALSLLNQILPSLEADGSKESHWSLR